MYITSILHYNKQMYLTKCLFVWLFSAHNARLHRFVLRLCTCRCSIIILSVLTLVINFFFIYRSYGLVNLFLFFNADKKFDFSLACIQMT